MTLAMPASPIMSARSRICAISSFLAVFARMRDLTTFKNAHSVQPPRLSTLFNSSSDCRMLYCQSHRAFKHSQGTMSPRESFNMAFRHLMSLGSQREHVHFLPFPCNALQKFGNINCANETNTLVAFLMAKSLCA